MALAEGGIYQQLAPDPRWACAGFDDAGIVLVRRRSVGPDVLARMELATYIPILTPEANIARARGSRRLPQMRAELDRLAADTSSTLAIRAAAAVAAALGDRN